MKRFVPALAAVILGSGCVVTTNDPCQGTVTVDWGSNGFLFASGAATYSCVTAGVDWIDVYVDGSTTPYSVACTAYATSIALTEGTHDFVIEGTDANGTILFRDWSNGTGTTCGATQWYATPAQGYADLTYSFFDVGACNSPSYMWFEVRDELTLQPAWVIDSLSSYGDKTRFSCGATPPRIALPAGNYTLQWMDEMALYAGPTFAINRAYNGVQPFYVAPGWPPSAMPMVTLAFP